MPYIARRSVKVDGKAADCEEHILFNDSDSGIIVSVLVPELA